MPVKVELEDMALLEFETCFFNDDDEEFYEDSMGMSKDLFKKFELLTPPQSPPHNPFPPDGKTNNSVDIRLKMASKALEKSENATEQLTIFENLSSNLIQDCMWSEPSLAAAGLISPQHKKSKLFHSSVSSSHKSLDSSVLQNTDINSSECVSPAAVFPYPVNEVPRKVEVPTFNLGSVAETPSPSESDEEEIDVVTVVAEKMARKRHCPSTMSASALNAAAVSSFKSHVAAIHNYSNTNSPPVSFSAPQSPQSAGTREVPSLLSNSHKRSRPMSMPASPQPAKKSRSLLHTTDLKRVVQKLKLSHHQTSSASIHRCINSASTSSRNSSDSEEGDTNKRAQHNVLERKRRNDLKYSFLRLRDNVPELSRQERSPKVTILKQSADYLRKITLKNQSLESELERTKLRFEHMKRKLMALRRECL